MLRVFRGTSSGLSAWFLLPTNPDVGSVSAVSLTSWIVKGLLMSRDKQVSVREDSGVKKKTQSKKSLTVRARRAHGRFWRSSYIKIYCNFRGRNHGLLLGGVVVFAARICQRGRIKNGVAVGK